LAEGSWFRFAVRSWKKRFLKAGFSSLQLNEWVKGGRNLLYFFREQEQKPGVSRLFPEGKEVLHVAN
jgi:hypothetical protein